MPLMVLALILDHLSLVSLKCFVVIACILPPHVVYAEAAEATFSKVPSDVKVSKRGIMNI